MKATELKRRYSGLWKEIADATEHDMHETEHVIGIDYIKRVAHNAAFNACYALHKRLKT